MLNRQFLLEGAAILVMAVACAAVSNGLASRDRKLNWISKPATRVARPAAEPSASPALTSQPMLTSTTGAVLPASTGSAATVALGSVTPPAQASAGKTAQTVSLVAPPQADPAPAPAPPASRQFPAHPDKPYVEISSDDAKILYDRGALFFDARRTSVFNKEHIARAENISVWEADLNEKVKQIFERNLDTETPIVVYCDGGACEDSHMLAQRLWGIGLNAVFVYKDGYPDWKEKGRPVVKGDKL